jgi:predicted RNase H-like HicB family nuclease
LIACFGASPQAPLSCRTGFHFFSLDEKKRNKEKSPLKKKLLKMHSVSLKSFKLVRLLPDSNSPAAAGSGSSLHSFFYAFFLRRNVSDYVGINFRQIVMFSALWIFRIQINFAIFEGIIMNNQMKKKINYTAIIEKSKDGWYVGQVQEIPEAIAQGKTINELKENLLNALELVMDFHREQTINLYQGRKIIKRKLNLA